MGTEALKVGWGGVRGSRPVALALLGLLLLSSAGCKRHVVLRVSAISLARAQAVEWQCEAGRPACAQEGIIEEAAWNQSRTEFLPLPECTAGVSAVFLDSDGPSSRAVVACHGEGTLTENSATTRALLLRSAKPSGPGAQLCAPGAASCKPAPSPPVPTARTFPLPDCGTGGIGRILITEPYRHPRLRVVCLDPKAAEVEEGCPGGAKPEPDLESGGFICPGATSSAAVPTEGAL